MSRRLYQISFGLAIGRAARFLLPGHHPISLLLTSALSLVGAAAGDVPAEQFLPASAIEQAGFALSALGAFALLLVYGVAVR